MEWSEEANFSRLKKMDSYEAAKVVHERIMRLEPEQVARKIVGYIYLNNASDQEMIRLALGPDQLIHNLVQKAKAALMLGSSPIPVPSPPISPNMNHPSPVSDASLQYNPFSPVASRPFSSPVGFRVSAPAPLPYWECQVTDQQQPLTDGDFIPLAYSDSPPDEYRFSNQFMGVEEQLERANLRNSEFAGDFYYPENLFNSGGSRIPLSQLEFPIKTCHYFNKGFCKHGSNCRYFHGQSFPESYPPRGFGLNSNENAYEDQMFSPGSLEKLELEITELLKSRRGSPVSIASLPMIYYEKYGRTLQAEGYLTESQRHGKAGYSLTKLLARLKGSIRLIDRPHGQHSVILAEDAHKYMESRGERNDPGPIVSGSRQIYLTFPAESTFTEEDVCNYFSTYGPVQDVRIPCQQKRMFGFVTFGSADTVKMILSKGNPHYVCGARVLVKPYREKSKLVDRKFQDKLEPHLCYHLDHLNIESELQARWHSSRMLRKQQMQEQEQALEFEMRRFSQLQLARKPLVSPNSFGYSMDELKLSEDCMKFPSAERYNQLLDVLNGSTSDDNLKQHPGVDCTDQGSNEGLNLPDSPFESVASVVASVI
ncbi:OLC1v1022548C1 [Oldenlandia corymbosa var. corymbosa]|uniref:OLC1v1022548C1 n=1 Tax=Oldenlandia corymbosa var. corymbosa TaxID=529605 RepID=A0AAV1BZJ0_OLDCO|nr:OLC1v1022548C1 [Oldenlandia corymbosa var. corymbosa]